MFFFYQLLVLFGYNHIRKWRVYKRKKNESFFHRVWKIPKKKKKATNIMHNIIIMKSQNHVFAMVYFPLTQIILLFYYVWMKWGGVWIWEATEGKQVKKHIRHIPKKKKTHNKLQKYEQPVFFQNCTPVLMKIYVCECMFFMVKLHYEMSEFIMFMVMVLM